jgi:hypothetical protein
LCERAIVLSEQAETGCWRLLSIAFPIARARPRRMLTMLDRQIERELNGGLR